MTRADKCLADAVKAGQLTESMARQAAGRVDELLQKGLSEAEAMKRAAEEIVRATEKERRRTALRILAAERTLANATAHPNGIAAGVAAIFARDMHGRAGYSSVEGRAKAIEATAHAQLAGLLNAYRRRNLGITQDRMALRGLVRAIYGDTADPAATGHAKAWSEVTDSLVARFNAAGGDLPRKETWRLPQTWDRAAVKRAGQGEFIRFMEDELARGGLRISDLDTGEPLSPARASDVIREAWERIATNGLSDMTPGQPGGVALANSRRQPRVFEWTSADSYLRWHDRFGGGDGVLFDNLVAHVRGISRDIAMLEILGPNPTHQARVLIDTARQQGASPTTVRLLGHIWNQVNGESSVPVSEWFATLMGGIRSWLTSAQLGSATLTAVTDFATMRQAAAFNGLSATDMMRRYVALLNPANEADKLTAVRAGLIADGWTRMAIAATRHQADVVGRDLPARIADFTMAVSGMNAHTQAGKWAFGMEFAGHLADQANRTLDQLAPELQATFRRYGVTAEDWDLIRRHGIEEVEGVRFVSAERLANNPDHLGAASRYLEMVQTETGYAVVEPGALERALALGGSRPGTPGGEFRRATMQYKSFPISMMTRHLARGLGEMRDGDRGLYLASIAISLTVMGALAMQMKQIAQGKDPRNMADARFWGAAFMQGGGAGILGDFLYSAVTRADRGFYMTAVGGPTLGLGDDLVRLTGGNIQALAEEKDTNFGRELARFVQRNTPGTSLWYGRLAMDRLMWNRLQELLDPHAARRWRREERQMQKDYDQRFFWAPGEPGPARAPSAAAAFGGAAP
jgi:uncharacterized protein YoaH (UPF0181 family)